MPDKIKLVCTAENYGDLWIEYDVSTWTLFDYVELNEETTVRGIIIDWIPRYSTAWHMRNSKGEVIAHPGKGSSKQMWMTVWRQFDVEASRALFGWLWLSALFAMQEAMSLPPKSLEGNTGESGGAGEVAGRDAGADSARPDDGVAD